MRVACPLESSARMCSSSCSISPAVVTNCVLTLPPSWVVHCVLLVWSSRFHSSRRRRSDMPVTESNPLRWLTSWCSTQDSPARVTTLMVVAARPRKCPAVEIILVFPVMSTPQTVQANSGRVVRLGGGAVGRHCVDCAHPSRGAVRGAAIARLWLGDPGSGSIGRCWRSSCVYLCT